MARVVIRAPFNGLWRSRACEGDKRCRGESIGYIRDSKTDEDLGEIIYEGRSGVVVWCLENCEDLKRGRAIAIIETDGRIDKRVQRNENE